MKKKLLFVNGHLGVGGVEKSLVDLLRALDYSKYEVDLLLLEADGFYNELLPSSVRVILFDAPKAYGPFLFTVSKNLAHLHLSYVFFRLISILAPFLGGWIYKLLRPILGVRKYYDCAIAYRVGMPNDIVSRTISSGKKICWWHNGECNYNAEGIEHINLMWKNMDCVVAVSNGCKDMIREKFEFYKDIIVIPNIIDVNAINELAGNQNPYIDKASLRIVTLGRLCWEKHVEDVPVIAKKLLDNGLTNFKWYIVGDGAKREEIVSKIRKFHLEDFVIMLGSKSNPYPYVKYADIMVHTSYIEAHCLTLLEAMSLHTPCIATRTMLPQDFTIDNENCILVEQNTDCQYYGVLRIIKMRTSDIRTMTDTAYEMVKKDFSKNNISMKFNILIANL